MIKLIIDLLQSDDWKATGSKEIEFAKGSHELATNFKKAKQKISRAWQSKK